MTKEKLSRLIIGNTKRFFKKNSTVILSGFAVVGVVATAVAVAKAVPKAEKAKKEAEEQKGEPLTKMETVKAEAPAYILATGIGLATTACIVGSTIISKKHEASLISAYGLVDQAFTRYRTKLIELHGEEADLEVRNALCREYADYHITGIDYPDQKAIWVDELSGQTIEAYEREIMDAEYHMNRNFTMRGYANLNEFYEFLGMKKTKEGECLGWSSSDGYYWLDFTHRLVSNGDDGGLPIYAIDCVFCPDADYLREWEWPPEDDPEDDDGKPPWKED